MSWKIIDELLFEASDTVRDAATVDDMLGVAALIPSPPALLPELCAGSDGGADTHPATRFRPVREAALAAGRMLADAARWTIIAVGRQEQRLTGGAGTFRGFGVDVVVSLSPAACAQPADPQWPVGVLLGAWVREQVAPEVTATAMVVAADAHPQHCLQVGSTLRRDLESSPQQHAVLVVADGATTLSTTAPGYLDHRAPQAQHDLAAAVGAGDREALAVLDPTLCRELGIAGRAGYQVLAGLFATDERDPVVRNLCRSAPFGVGYQVSVWQPGRPT